MAILKGQFLSSFSGIFVSITIYIYFRSNFDLEKSFLSEHKQKYKHVYKNVFIQLKYAHFHPLNQKAKNKKHKFFFSQK